MKRRITHEQIQELTPRQCQKLKELWNPQAHDIIITDGGQFFESYENAIAKVENNMLYHYNGVQINIEDVMPLLDIGQMIEFLTDNNCCSFEFDGRIDFDWYDGSSTLCLCDALWESVKEMLNKEATP